MKAGVAKNAIAIHQKIKYTIHSICILITFSYDLKSY